MSELEKLCRLSYGAYEFLRDHDLSKESGTSRRLRNDNISELRSRLAEELLELKGVLEGTHFHEGFEKDIVLEGYEVWYWNASLMVAQHLDYTLLEPHLSLEAGYAKHPSEWQELRSAVPELITKIQSESSNEEESAVLSNRVLQFVGSACARNASPPALLLKRDLDEMKEKPYLTQYFQMAMIPVW